MAGFAKKTNEAVTRPGGNHHGGTGRFEAGKKLYK
jgi:hypothetical protein